MRTLTPGLDAPGGATTAGFRRDIQGLRAVAVASVVLNHAHIGVLSGGFVGVDVFFVISGFLITQLLLSEARHTGRVGLLGFYRRRARRILPAATVVIVSTLAASVLLLNYVQAAAVVRDSVWATFFVANVKFGRDESDYFAAGDPASVLQHFWSLAVEEQFYLVWPLLLVCLVAGYAAWLRRRDPGPHSHASRDVLPGSLLLTTLALIATASLTWSIVLTDASPPQAYFSTFARAWELATGAACTVLLPVAARLPIAVRTFVAWLGLAGILTAVFSFSAATPFPGYAVALPVLGTALMVVGGSGRVRGGPTALLALRPCQRLGDWSYSLYLWHWPLLLVPATAVGHSLSQTQNLGLLVIALGLSVATYHWVESPFRRSPRVSAVARRGLLLYPAATVVSLLACVLANQVVQQEVAAASTAPPVTSRNYGSDDSELRLSRDHTVALVQASVQAARNHLAIPGELQPALLDLRRDIPDTGDCNYGDTWDQLCRRGAAGSDKVLVAFGDSHARQWIPALETIAQREGYATYYLVKPGCSAADIVPDFGDGPHQFCVDFRRWAMEQVEKLHPDVLVLANDLPPGVDNAAGDRVSGDSAVAHMFSAGLQRTIDALQGSVGRTVVLGDAPGVPEMPADCLAARNATLGDCAFPRSERSVLLFQAAREGARASGADFVSPLEWFCADGDCPVVVGSTVTYRDTEHITSTYAAQLADPLGEALDLSVG